MEASDETPERSVRLPATLMMVAAAAWQAHVLFVTATAMPATRQLYQDLGATLPLVTRVFIAGRWLFYLAPLPTLAVAAYVGSRKEPSPRFVMAALALVVASTLGLDGLCRAAAFAPMFTIIDQIK